MAYMIGVGIAGGRIAAVRASAGVALGVLVYSIVVATGAGEVVARFPWVLLALKICGAAYLIWLGVDALRSARRAASLKQGESTNRRWFLRGLVVNLTNPKMILFFLAFLPQFAGDADSATAQFVALGISFLLVGFVVDTVVGVFAGTLQARLWDSPRAIVALHSAAASVFFILAAVVIWEALSR